MSSLGPMTASTRIWMTALATLLAAVAQPAAAASADKCKLGLVAKLPVIMEGPRASVSVGLNGRDSRLWLDSGAFFNLMPKAKAVELGLKTEPLPFGFYVSGIGGSFVPELTRVRDFTIAGATLHDMEFVVGGSDAGNGFLGANLLGILTTEFDLAKGAVNLFREQDCGKLNLAYWGKGMAVGEANVLAGEHDGDHHIYVEVFVNNRAVRAMLDTGATTSILGSRAARRAGIDLDDPKVVISHNITGVGAHRRKSWIARAQIISIGGEDIKNSPIRIVDDTDDADSSEMLLGVDFLMAHHVLVSHPQRKMFLTYNGGPIFSASTEDEVGHLTTRAENFGQSEQAAEPTSADQFAGRASARLHNRDTAGAIADFTSALKLEPKRTEFLAGRSAAYLRAGEPGKAAADIDAALGIAPGDHRMLIRRAQLRLRSGNLAGATADAEAAEKTTPAGSLDMADLAGLYSRLGKADRAAALMGPVLDLHRRDSSFPQMLNARSWHRALAAIELDEAMKDIDRAIKLAGPLPSFLDTRAVIALRQKNYAAAVADETAALAKTPNLAPALYTRGLARLATGDKSGGEADIAAARAIRPSLDQTYAPYGLRAPGAGAVPTSAIPAEEDEDKDDEE